ncbi:hypothetical protein NIA71_11430 [Ihubacter massiliensis]|uniref:Uncharacterized protein n=1 Tax=Hominibacterium faecale TaxID=2839743 RepID=A0A9J6QLP8_9FIRM|nr:MULTISPECIES: hypothetical protein [Eubacteriales Family XIII. Incertae Sedis]MCI7304495.1 hypothetical protein [Clostridia bacterium]MDY3013363.1 hypothetical protein [Clostridiales Family XIII bacterium]MCO7122553.1 hypothetical protein [Ihubacter massiliensis]MCU7376829.1 hypothetical protein [Hominibacterium faecale]MCU7379378.1 hypothetical protein [Hominibacterium faecale]
MKSIFSTIKEFSSTGDDTPIPKHPVLTIWIIWFVGIIVLFDIVFADEILSPSSRTAIFLGAGMIISMRSFHNRAYVNNKLKKRCTSLIGYLYGWNFIAMVIGEASKVINQWGEIGPQFIAKESVFLLFWFLSIPLVLLYNPWRWGIWAAAIFIGTIAYKLILDECLKYWSAVTLPFLLLTGGLVLIATIVSWNISRRRIKKLFG